MKNASMKNAMKNASVPKVNASSFTGVSMKNSAMAVANNVKSTANTFVNSTKNAFSKIPVDITDPIKESLQGSFSNTSSPMVSIPIIITIGILIVLLIIAVMFRAQIAIGIEFIIGKLKELLDTSQNPIHEKEKEEKEEKEEHKIEKIEHEIETIIPSRKEVFNVADDKYTYTDAEPLCKAFGAELATYDQVKEAWNKGADWCNYGWVKGQTAIYPTQQSTYDKLQAGPEEQRGVCGIPGINGGYFDNPELKFGVNCYGKKPNQNETDNRHMMNPSLAPGALEYDRKVQNYKDDMNQIAVNPFKEGTWTS